MSIKITRSEDERLTNCDSPMSSFKWQDPVVKSYFIKEPSSTPAAPSPSKLPSQSKSQPHKGVIAGVIISFAGLLLCVTVVWCLYRRRQAHRIQKMNRPEPRQPHSRSELQDHQGPPVEVDASLVSTHAPELQTGLEAPEMQAMNRYEIEGTMVPKMRGG